MIKEALKISTSSIHYKLMRVGLLIEIKEEVAASATERDRILCAKVMGLLEKYNLSTEEGRRVSNLSIVVQSFNWPVLYYLSGKDIPLV